MTPTLATPDLHGPGAGHAHMLDALFELTKRIDDPAEVMRLTARLPRRPADPLRIVVQDSGIGIRPRSCRTFPTAATKPKVPSCGVSAAWAWTLAWPSCGSVQATIASAAGR